MSCRSFELRSVCVFVFEFDKVRQLFNELFTVRVPYLYNSIVKHRLCSFHHKLLRYTFLIRTYSLLNRISSCPEVQILKEDSLASHYIYNSLVCRIHCLQDRTVEHLKMLQSHLNRISLWNERRLVFKVKSPFFNYTDLISRLIISTR